MFKIVGQIYELNQCGIRDYDSARMAILEKYGTCSFVIVEISRDQVRFRLN